MVEFDLDVASRIREMLNIHDAAQRFFAGLAIRQADELPGFGASNQPYHRALREYHHRGGFFREVLQLAGLARDRSHPPRPANQDWNFDGYRLGARAGSCSGA